MYKHLNKREMKKVWSILILTALLMSCGDENGEMLADELEKLKQENIELKEQTKVIAEKDSAINEYAKFIMDIQNNLNKINEKENSLLLKSRNPELNGSDATIISDMQELGKLLAENKAKVNSMKAKLSNANIQISDLESVVLNLTDQVEKKDTEIMGLKGELSDLGVAFDELLSAYEDNIVVLADKNEIIETQENELNTAYYTFGSVKELKNNGVISKEGGFIGIGKTKKLKDDFNKDYFTKVDITKATTITLGVSKAKLVTTHPEGTYELTGEKLVIADPKKFWSVSKYLVIETK